MPTPTLIHCYAKLNLCLYIGAPLPSGNHPLVSVFQSISLHDTLEVTPHSEKKCVILQQGGAPIASEQNLLTKVFEALKDDLETGLQITLHKHIPMGAGLGGGSSDAAGLLGYLQETYPSKISKEKIIKIAAALGSDIPFFLTGNQALVSGTGEIISSVQTNADHWFILITPPIHSNTKIAYQAFDEDCPSPQALPFLDPKNLSFTLGENDLKDPVFKRLPTLKTYAENIRKITNIDPFMTGSGAALYLAFSSQEKANSCYRLLAKNLPQNELHQAVPTSRGYAIKSVG